MQHYIVGFTINNRHGNYYSARYNNTWVNNTEQAHAYQEYYSRYPWIRERIVEHGSFSLQVSLTQDEFDTLVKGA